MLDTIRATLIKRAFLDTKYLTETEVDALLAKNFGEDWKVRYGIETQAEADKRQKPVAPISAYTGKSLHQIEDERLQKEKDEALEKARKDWQKKQRAKARRAKAEAKKKNKILGDKNV